MMTNGTRNLRRIIIITESILLALAAMIVAPVNSARAEVVAYEGSIQIPTYPWLPPVRHPFFRGTDGRNIYPYPMLDNLQRTKEQRSWRTVVLENEYLRVTFLPELGGKVYDVLDKTTQQPVFYVNHVVKPGLIAQCGAWVSGGIEFNTGPAGHTVSAVQPVNVVICPPGADGSMSVAVGEVEKVYRTHWTVVVTLRPGRSFLEERIRIYNATETVRPYYFWNCTAVPNTKGFRFIYPMTLGTDHSGKIFFTWPMDKGKDLSLGVSYQDASSIFAHECDQDFFGSYDEDADRGVVACANHQLLPGKKAWTWGHGSYGTMHQMDLTDDDGPYNEVQTGPLPTQADVGRLDPSEAVSWDEWWYPVHGIGGFTFADRNIAVNAKAVESGLELRIIGTGTWEPVEVCVLRGKEVLASARSSISPKRPANLNFAYANPLGPVQIQVKCQDEMLASFRVPLDLPVRTPPEKRPPASAPSELAQAGWQEFLFANFPEAESRFQQALEKDAKNVQARTGLAFLNLDRAPATTVTEARAALAVDPDAGLASFALATAALRLGDLPNSLDNAWKSSLDPVMAIPGQALAAKILIRQGEYTRAIEALSAAGPWQSDSVCRNRLAFAMLKSAKKKAAVKLAKQNLDENPLDAFARSILWLAGADNKLLSLGQVASGKSQEITELVAEYSELGQHEIGLRILKEFYVKTVPENEREPILMYWGAYLANLTSNEQAAGRCMKLARALPTEGVFPHRIETVRVLEWAIATNPADSKAALYLGHLLFSLGRHSEGQAMWRRAAESSESKVIACRALGMACRQLDNDLQGAAEWLELANQADPSDPIVARDLARVLFSLADKSESKEQKQDMLAKIRGVLIGAFDAGKGRSDFVALLARAQNQLGEYAQTAKLLDSVRITIWEGAREAHDFFETAHLALGTARLEAGRAKDALAEFDRALEYPENLATGKLEGTREAHIHYLRGNALDAMGQTDAAINAWQKAADEPPSTDQRKLQAQENARKAIQQARNKNRSE